MSKVNYWKKPAEQGGSNAQYYLGNAYWKEWDNENHNQEQAIKWWQKAAEQGHVIAQYKLGIAYKNGLGVTKDYKKALQLLHKVAEHDNDPLVIFGNSQNETVRKSAYEALEDITKLEKKENAKKELENMMGLIAHKFRGSIQVISYNAQHENQPNISLDSVATMRGLFEIFGIISTPSDILCQKLLQDMEGEETILTTLEKSLSLALADLLKENNRNKILQHYIAYAKKKRDVDINVTPRQWRRKREYLDLWEQLQTQWQETFMITSEKFDWVRAHLFPLELNINDDNVIHFERYGVTESILVIAMTEIILNAIKYYSVQENTTVKIDWKIQADFCIFSCENPYSENESKQSDKGSSKGQIFLKTITKKLGWHFSILVSQNHYIAELKIPTYLLIEEKI